MTTSGKSIIRGAREALAWVRSRSGAKRHTIPIHPGKIFREEFLPELGLARDRAAERLGLSEENFEAFLAERLPVDDTLAGALGQLCNQSPEVWLNLQRSYDWDAFGRKTTGTDLRWRDR